MAISLASSAISGGCNLRTCELQFSKCSSLGNMATSAFPTKSKRFEEHQKFAVRAQNSNADSGGGGGDFVAGFLLGGAVCGTLAYIFAPQIRRSLLNEDEYGFRKARRPIYYDDEGLEKTRQTLNTKLSQLNAAIDNVSTRLRGGNNTASVPVESDPEVEATM
ncbi:Threonylcarbamoyl-AMP synthase [Bienertia sinuspersici]